MDNRRDLKLSTISYQLTNTNEDFSNGRRGLYRLASV